MVDVRDEFKECQGFSREEVEGLIVFNVSFLTKQSKFLYVYNLYH